MQVCADSTSGRAVGPRTGDSVKGWYLSQGVRFEDRPTNYPDAVYSLDQAVMVLRSSGAWTKGRVAFIHPLGRGQYWYTVRVDLDHPGEPRLKQFITELKGC